jgi:hypothetical protein
MKGWRPSGLAILLALPSCKQEVDPAYLERLDSSVSAVCACNELPKAEQIDCVGRNGNANPDSTPTGDAPGVYERKLDARSREKLARLREKWADCERRIMR